MEQKLRRNTAIKANAPNRQINEFNLGSIVVVICVINRHAGK